MSTKTTFKRVALVAVAALGFGMLSVVPSQAAGMLADTLVNAADGSATVASTATVGSGTAATAKIVYSAVATGASDTATVTGTITSVPATSGAYAVTFAATGGTSPDSTSPSLAISGTTLTASAAGRVTKYITASFTPDVAGTYVIAIKTAGGSNNQTVTWTVTATGVPAATAAASIVAYKNGNASLKGAYEYFRNFGNNSGHSAQETIAGAITLLVAEGEAQQNAAGAYTIATTPALAGTVVGGGLVEFSNKTLAAANTAESVPMTVAISGRGYVAIGDTSTTWATSITETAAAGFTPWGDAAGYGRLKFFKVMSDGTTGPATVTISAGGVTLETIDLVFTGAKASLALATGTSTKLSKSHVGPSETATVTINGLDASGNILAASGITAVTDSDATNLIATASISGEVVTVTGGAVSGTVTWTVTDGTRTVTFVTNTTKKTAKTVTLAMSPTAPAPGEKVTVTITATDSNGSPVADGSRQLFATGLAMNLAVGSSTCTTTGLVTLVAGVATCTFFAPATSGTLVVSAKEGSAVDNVATNGAAAALTVSAELTVANAALDAATAATDAAAEAIDAANAATDAANAAAEAADAATAAAQDAADAVAALSVSVAAMIDALKKQITSLTNLVIKIQKKVKA
jgi:hypothetical protein